jgi:hypothetical protein
LRRWRNRNQPTTIHAGCYLHPTQPSVGTCTKCHNQVCESCHLEVADTSYCMRCAMYTAGVSTRRP